MLLRTDAQSQRMEKIMARVRNVRVVNTTAEPIPVQAQQSGTWNVGINGTPTVRIDAANNTIKIIPQTTP